jgi:hypothetical protein
MLSNKKREHLKMQFNFQVDWHKWISYTLFQKNSRQKLETAGAISDTFSFYLPLELQIYVFEFFEVHDLQTAKLVSKKWNQIAKDDYLWKKIFSKKFGPAPYKPNCTLTWEELCMSYTNITWDPSKCHQMILSNNLRTVRDDCKPEERYKWTTACSKVRLLHLNLILDTF